MQNAKKKIKCIIQLKESQKHFQNLKELIFSTTIFRKSTQQSDKNMFMSTIREILEKNILHKLHD